MRVLMLGWEFPPFYAGGIGMVCYEQAKELARLGVEVTYLMPFGPQNINPGFLKKMLIAENLAPYLKVKTIPTGMHAYLTEEEYLREQKMRMLNSTDKDTTKSLYGMNLMEEVHNFAERAMAIAELEEFDIIHCHDWMTIPAAVGIKQRTGRPLVVHVHNTVYDRYLSGSNSVEWDIEQLGLKHADTVIAISHYVKNTLINNYQVDPNKIIVVHNAQVPINFHDVPIPRIAEMDQVVLYAGRVTVQKGPDYFVRAAQIVAQHIPNAKFVVAGSGDLLNQCIDLAAELGIADKVLFPGFFNQEQREQLFAMASVYVMPSVSEPFGLVALEGMATNTPTIISNQSGVSEVVNHVLKVDFWDVHQLAEKIISVLKYEELHNELKHHGALEVSALTWDKHAQKVKSIYEHMVATIRV